MTELRNKRVDAGISQQQLAEELRYSRSRLWRLETEHVDATIVELSEVASLLGYELSVGLHPVGDPIRDKGHQALGWRFDAIPSAAWRVTSETLLPNPGDHRSWDRLLRLITAPSRHVVGAELETRIRDIQALVRRTRLRERDGGVDAILIVLSDSSANRALVGQLRESLGSDYQTSARAIFTALRGAKPLPGSGVILI